MEEEEEIEDDQDFDFTYDGEVLSLGKSELNSNKNPTQISVRDTPKIGRNDACPCGSGKKYKKCCSVNQ
jgi:preprotein translocase subunit SecA